MNKKVEINFESALSDLESIVEELESGDLSLENSLNLLKKESSLQDNAKKSFLKQNYKFKN